MLTTRREVILRHALTLEGGALAGTALDVKTIAFGNYVLLERIAVGGMAEVFLAAKRCTGATRPIQKTLDVAGPQQILAIKRILPQLAEDKAFIEMFIDEARIAGQLSHANITPIYELGEVGGAHYIAMEHVWGKDLLQIMNRFRRMRSRMPADMVAFIGARVGEALDYAHHKRDRTGKPLGLIHRDVSPQNILVSYDGAVKLIDFGVAKARTRTTKTEAGVVKGKFGYLSPEQAKGRAIDHRADLFVLGTCLYEMLTLERLFVQDTDFATMEMIRKAKIPPPSERVPGTAAVLDDIVMKALTKDPAKRYQRAAEIQEDLSRIITSEEPPFTSAELAEWMRKAFAEEIAQEKARLDRYTQMDTSGEIIDSAPRSSKGFDSDPRIRTARRRPLHDTDADHGLRLDEGALLGDADALMEEDWSNGPTQIFFSSEALLSPQPSASPGQAPEPLEDDPTRIDELSATTRAAFCEIDRGGARASLAHHEAPSSAPPLPHPVDARGSWPSDGTPILGDEPGIVERLASRAAALIDERTPLLGLHGRARGAEAKLPGSVARAPIPAWQAATAAFLSFLLGANLTFFVLKTRSEPGRVEVHAYPEVPAHVHIDGVYHGQPPITVDTLTAGPHVVTIEAEGFRSVHRPVVIQPDYTVSVHVELAPEGAPSP